MGIILGGLLPERAAAASGNTSLNFLFGGQDPRTGDQFSHYHFESSGWGGRATTDGNNAVTVPHSVCRNTPIEVFETRYPWVHESYGLDCDVAGAGKHRGGLGIQRVMEVGGDVITVSVLADRAKGAPWGLFGGREGSRTRIELKRADEPDFRPVQEALHLVSPTKFSNLRMYRGDKVRLTTPSGGGYGNPLERDPQLVARDVREGFVSRGNGELLYGVVLGDDGEPDVKATQLRRREMQDGLASA